MHLGPPPPPTRGEPPEASIAPKTDRPPAGAAEIDVERADGAPPRVRGTIVSALSVTTALFVAGSFSALYYAWDGLDGGAGAATALGFQVFMTLLALLSVIGAFLFIQQQVFLPLDRIARAMRALAGGNAGVEVPELDREDEIGAMARAIDVFKRNALDLRRGENERAQLEERMRTLLAAVEHSPVPIMITNARGVIEYVNPKFAESSGFRSDEVLGQRPGLFKSGQTPPEVYRDLWQTILSGREWRGELYNRRKDGECYWEKSSIAPIRDSAGRISHFVAVKEDITERKDAERRAWQQAHFDPLTELPNRLLFEDRLNQAIARSNRSGRLLALMFVDLDHFKQVNDRLGHEAGDELLQEAALRLRAAVRESDTVSRVGGDEFLVLLTDLNRDEEAAEVAGRILRSLARPFELDAGEATIGVSIGIAMYPRDGHIPAVLLKNADTAMYWSKSAGRNTYRFFSSDPVAYIDGL